MTFSIHGLPVSRGIAIGRAVLVASSRMDVAHYFVTKEDVPLEIDRLRIGRDKVTEELERLQKNIGFRETSNELSALIDVHLMLLKDEELINGVKSWVTDRLYNAEWALTSQLEVLGRQFDEMEDDYLRERKADLEQIVEKVLRAMKGFVSPILAPMASPTLQYGANNSFMDESQELPLILVTHDLSPAEMLHFKQSVFVGFVTDVGGKTSHTAIVARSLDIPAVVGARQSTQLIRQDDLLIIDGDAGLVVVDPSPVILADYRIKQGQADLALVSLSCLRHTPSITIDGIEIELLANIEMPEDALLASQAGADGVGLFRSEFLFMGLSGHLPGEEEQYRAYSKAIEGMGGLPVTIRTVDIGADKPIEHGIRNDLHLNPALGLRAIRWSLSDPEMFMTQLRAILRAAALGPVKLLIPMLVHGAEIRQTLSLIRMARSQLDERGVAYGEVKVGAMIEIPAAALTVPTFLKYFDFVSIGTNDLIQYTLAVDRADESVAHLYDPLHPAVLFLIANTISICNAQGKGVSVCGEMAGDVSLTKLLLGLGLRSFSMHPSQILKIKHEILQSDIGKLTTWAYDVIHQEDPSVYLEKSQ